MGSIANQLQNDGADPDDDVVDYGLGADAVSAALDDLESDNKPVIGGSLRKAFSWKGRQRSSRFMTEEMAAAYTHATFLTEEEV
eukprot:COSAG01_NODE_47738_length_387_cov_1.250000_1_plen_83_part_01